MHIDQALDRFLIQLEADGRSIHTRRQYARHVRLLARWAHDLGHTGVVGDISPEDIARFLVADVAKCGPDGRAKRASSMNALRGSLSDSSDGYEADLVLELEDGIWAIEVKLSSASSAADLARIEQGRRHDRSKASRARLPGPRGGRRRSPAVVLARASARGAGGGGGVRGRAKAAHQGPSFSVKDELHQGPANVSR